ncbi:MAG: LodA/GoxA family CTQ-dependent oxidase, partial [Bryobacteraceae bacterium]
MSLPAYRIHPGIGIARIGDSPDEFYISPERPGAMPTACDSQGNPLLSPDGTSELPVSKFKDAEGRLKRAAARFQIYAYDDASPGGRPLSLGDPVFGGGNHGTLIDIQWRVYLANKKAVWFEFSQLEGEHGYADGHKRRNAGITDSEGRQRLIIDPGPRVVNSSDLRRASFSMASAKYYAPTFPPHLRPRSIETLGDILTDSQGRLLVLGGHGHSGSYLDGFGQPRIETYANNDGWFDDTSDGPVMARLVMFSTEVGAIRYVDVEYPSWVIAAYPRYAPEILDMVTIEDVVMNTAIREMAYRTDLFGTAGTFDNPQKIDSSDLNALMHWKAGPLEWNPGYTPWFYRDIWPILFRADEMSYLSTVLGQSNFPHNQSSRGNFDPFKLGVPPVVVPLVLTRLKSGSAARNHSGRLFVEALEPLLIVLDDQLKQMSLSQAEGFSRAMEAGDSSNIQEELMDALSEFANAVHGPFPGGDPDAYLISWQQIYQREQSEANYRAAKRAMEDRVGRSIARLYERALPDGTAVRLMAARRPSDDGETRVDRQSLDLRDAANRYLNEFLTGRLLQSQFQKDVSASTHDAYRQNRLYLEELLRQPGEENEFRLAGRPNSRLFRLPLMPLLAGDNPISNTLPSKFLRLTDYQLFILRQWAAGDFVNEVSAGWVKKEDVNLFAPYEHWVNRTAEDLDRGVLMNLLGGAFCPGGELNWIIRNPAVYRAPFRLKAAPDFSEFRQTAAQSNANASKIPVSENNYIASTEDDLSQDSDFETGLEPGDLTKYMALPWQADFNECTTQMID